MSYILDALKKSEQEHKKGQVPGLGTVQGLPGPGGRFETDRLILIYGLATILVAILAIGTWLYLRKTPPAPEQAPQTATAQLPSGNKPAPITASIPAPPARTDAKTVPAPPTTKPVPPPPAQPQAAVAANPVSPKAMPPETAAQPAPVAQPTPSAALSPVTPVQLLEKNQPPARGEETATTPPSSEGNGPEKAEDAIKPELMPVVPLEELPAALRAEMPEVKIGVHLFRGKPASRRVSLNGRLMREGQQVEKDLVLVEIIKQGVILSFKGRRFTVPVFPR